MATLKLELLALAAACALLTACSEPASPEARVRAFIGEVEQLAEAREYIELVDRIAGDYLDERGNDKLKAAAILRGFYLKNKSVHLLVRIDNVSVATPERASARIYVAMARQPFAADALVSIPDADMHRLDLELAADGDSWEILQATWRRAHAANVLF